MEGKNFKELVGKKVFIQVRDNWHYTGTILCVGDEWVKMRDKFDKIVMIEISEIKFVREEG